MQKYEIMSVIGQGAYGVVLKCRDIECKNYVAVKKFKETDDDEHTKKTTMREVKILKMAKHPAVVQLKQAFRKRGIVYLVFQYVENNLLEVLEKSQSGLKPHIIRKLMYQLLKGLSYLHKQNIVHRDIKPQNLLVSQNYRLKICDFGFARQFKQKDEQITDYVATRWYRPPELLVGGDYGKEIDIWAVACIMCELIDGNPLFPGQNQLDQLFLIQKCLGALTPDLYQRFIKNQRFLGMKFPEIQNLDRIDKKYFGKICPKGINLIKSMLKLDPKQRITAAQALQHQFFDVERQQQKNQILTDHRPEVNSRKQIYTTSTTKRKKESQTNYNNKFFDKGSKNGKIYNRKNNLQAPTYKSTTNNQNIGKGGNSKSLGKGGYKKMTYGNDRSLEKHYNKDILMKTDVKGFYIDLGEEKLSGYGDMSKKSTEVASVPSNQQLPILLYSQIQSVEQSARRNPKLKSQQLPHKNNHNQFNIKNIMTQK